MTPPGDADAEVIVVGAGPVGLLLAAELRLGGAEVVVLERRATPATESRASTLHARTVEILDSRGLFDTLGDPLVEPRGHFGGLPLDLTLPSAFPGQWKVAQTDLEVVLRERVVGLGADLRTAHEVHQVEQADGHVEARADGPDGPVRVRGRFLVGCDGEHSTVRAAAGFGTAGQEATRELLRADVTGIDVPGRRFQRLPGGLAVAARRGGVTRVMVHELGRPPRRSSTPPDFGELVVAWKRVTGEDISGGTPVWVDVFDDTNRQVTKYRAGRVLLAGDAAHQRMPIGGQAVNLGLQDAFNLGWKLAAHVVGAAPETLVDSYHDERHPVGRRVLANIAAQAALLLGGPEAEPLRTLLGELIELPDVREHLAAMIAGLDITYAVGAGNHPLLGRPLPRTPLTTEHGRSTSAELARTGKGLLLGPPRAPTHAAAAPWAGRVTAVAARPTEPDPWRGAGSVLVRPDGHVVWTDADAGPVDGALRRWFGAPGDRR